MVGKKQDNPLSLLGQYSDGDSDEDILEEHNNDDKYISITKGDLLVQDDINHHENVDPNTVNDGNFLDNKVARDEVETDLDHGDADVNSSMMAQQSTDVPSQMSVSEASAFQISVDTVGIWKVQLDEQTNQYYYWNTETGETSWEVPSGLIAAAQNLEQSISSKTNETINSVFDPNASKRADQAIGANNNAPTSAQHSGGLSSINSTTYGIQTMIEEGPELDTHLFQSIQANGISFGESATMPGVISSHHAHVLPTSDHTLYPTIGTSKGNDSLDFDSTELVSYGESLLQRLILIGRTGKKMARHEALRKEIEIRLSDCKALSSYGSSLMPFWWHTETQLKQLDSCIATEAASLDMTSDEVDIGTQSISRGESSQGGLADPEPELAMKGGNTSVIDETNHYPMAGSSTEEGINYGPISEDKKELKEVSEGMVATANPSSKLAAGLEMHTEDIDMDVEMEVDDDIVEKDQSNLITNSSPSKQPSEASPLSFIPVVPSDESTPPPPYEEWIPPPPPESEPVPPPPPLEDLNELISPPSYELPAQSFLHEKLLPSHSFQEQYSLAYNTPAYNFYASASGVVASSAYCANVGEVANPSQAAFSETANANAFPLVATAIENVVENREYYQAANASVAPVPAFSSIDSSGCYNSAVPLHGEVVSAESLMASQGNSATIVKPASVNPSETTKSSSTGNPPATDISSTNDGGINVMSMPVTRNQSKVVRSKKRLVPATTLRSNKKVSSLVDKWKAAKEELQAQEDEEPENPYDVLERKRQKEIEEWHARQISSGEAQDNANFVPLGGNWREKVKRRKAKAEAVQSPPKEAVDEEKKKPNLVELAKNLPPGWQAYWDETSKDVYYGNTITSETTWTRPSR